FDKTAEKFGRIDILFNNAGIGATKPTHEVSYAEYRKTVNVDLDAVFLFSKFAIDYFREQGSGNIINTASMYGWIGAAGNAAYNAAKGGVIRSEEHTSELQSRFDIVCRLLLENK